jgi:hypothetical protein
MLNLVRLVDAGNVSAVKELCLSRGFLAEIPSGVWWCLGFVGGLLVCNIVVQVWQLIIVRKAAGLSALPKMSFGDEDDEEKQEKKQDGGGKTE